jgi:hypothetical protein
MDLGFGADGLGQVDDFHAGIWFGLEKMLQKLILICNLSYFTFCQIVGVK